MTVENTRSNSNSQSGSTPFGHFCTKPDYEARCATFVPCCSRNTTATTTTNKSRVLKIAPVPYAARIHWPAICSRFKRLTTCIARDTTYAPVLLMLLKRLAAFSSHLLHPRARACVLRAAAHERATNEMRIKFPNAWVLTFLSIYSFTHSLITSDTSSLLCLQWSSTCWGIFSIFVRLRCCLPSTDTSRH